MRYPRRNFLKKISSAGAAVITAPALHTLVSPGKVQEATSPFKLRYAPHLSMFSSHAGKDFADNIRFCYDMGFRAMFDNDLMSRPVADQDRIAGEMHKRGMELGPFVLYADFGVTSFVLGTREVHEMLVGRMKAGVETARRTGAKWALVVPGRYDEKLPRDYQTANIVENLRYCCDVVEPEGLVIVIEPLNTIRDHPGLFLNGIPQAYAICKGVNRKSCKIVDDIYHQQITEGNLIPNIEMAWNEIAAFHCGDNPGRNEPGTGEINFKNVFRFIYSKGYQGVICMEHGISGGGTKEGEEALIKAYREADNFQV